MEVKFTKLEVPTRQIKNRYLKSVKELLNGGNFILTKEVWEFEEAWAKILNVKYCIGTSNGADSLYLALLACGVGPGDEVITQGNAYNATVVAILRTGAITRFADINSDTLQIDVSKIEKLITPKTKAILPVHLFGQANNMEVICKIAKNQGIAVVEDCAQAHLARFKDKLVGSWGNVGAFSFYPTKNLGAFGDAGAVVTNDEKIYKKILSLRNLGEISKNNHECLGFNMRLDPIQALCLKLKLDFLNENTKKREEAGAYYDKLIEKAGFPVKPVKRDQNANHVYHLYVVQSENYNRDKLKKELLNRGVQTAIHYPFPVYRQPFYRKPADFCPVTDEVSGKILSLPIFVGITKKEQVYVIQSIKEIISNG